jgi:hypothetical protein
LFQGKPVNAKKPAKKGGNQQMAYLMAAVESLVKKGLKKAMKSKKRSVTTLLAIPILNRKLGPVTQS